MSTSFHAGNAPARTMLSNDPLACSRAERGTPSTPLSKGSPRRHQQDSPPQHLLPRSFSSCACSVSDKRSQDFVTNNENQVQEQVPAPRLLCDSWQLLRQPGFAQSRTEAAKNTNLLLEGLFGLQESSSSREKRQHLQPALGHLSSAILSGTSLPAPPSSMESTFPRWN